MPGTGIPSIKIFFMEEIVYVFCQTVLYIHKTTTMRRSYFVAALLITIISPIAALSQNIIITGNIKNSQNQDVVPAVSVTVKGSSAGTFTDEKGNFRLVSPKQPPLTLVITSIGYEQREITVTGNAPVSVQLVPAASLGTEVVVSASRVPERILESPVSIERISAANIRNAPVASYYDLLKNVKSVDLTYSSLTFATPSTRGFNGSGNARFNQLMDGMDNQAPGLNFSVGGFIGLTELDVESMELLPGASSALYGPGGMNGTLMVNSKDPFKYQGLSFQAKTGIMHVDNRQRPLSPYYDWSFRWAQKVSDKFAFKLGAQLIQAKDWMATDTSNYQAGDPSTNQYGNVKPGSRTTDPNYDGVNVYGDETNANMLDVTNAVLATASAQYSAQYQQATGVPPTQAQVNAFLATNSQTSPFYNGKKAGLIPSQSVSRTGYLEKDVIDNNTINVRLSGGLYYKFTPNLQLSLSGYFGTGNTVYTASDRYSLKDLKMGQYKLELQHTNWFVRAYTTQENAGESYNATITTRIFNEAWKSSNVWYPTYVGNFVGARSVGADVNAAHLMARAAADQGRPAPGSPQFKQTFDQIRKTPISKGGGLFLDKSNMYMVEGQYNFGNVLKFADLLAGGNWKQYVLNSQGTLFADTAGNIRINEYGAYAQLSRSLLNDRLKLTAAGRYDKSQNFKGRFTPRFTAVYTVAPDHNIRASYQTAYRFPTTQNQWINLVVGGGTVLLGGLPQLRDFYHFNTNKTYTLSSVGAFGMALATGTPPAQAMAMLQEARFNDYKPETMRSYELGYKGLFAKKVLVDVYGYYGKYENFLGRTIVLQAKDGNPMSLLSSSSRMVYSVAVNSASKVTTYGGGASVEVLLPASFSVMGNISADRITDVPAGFISFFDVPNYRLNIGVSNSGFGYQKRFGFNVMMRNQDGFFYESDFRQGPIDGFTTVDAQVSYKFPEIRSVVKLGGSNITNQYYKTAFANPEIGGMYYVSFAYNVF